MVSLVVVEGDDWRRIIVSVSRLTVAPGFCVVALLRYDGELMRFSWLGVIWPPAQLPPENVASQTCALIGGPPEPHVPLAVTLSVI